MMLIAALLVVVGQAANPAKRTMTMAPLPQKAVATPVAINAKPAPAAWAKGQTSAKARAPKKAVAASAEELAGTYLWEYKTTSDQVNQDPTAVAATESSQYVKIAAGENNVVNISGMFDEVVAGTYYPENGYILIPSQNGYTSTNYGECWITPLFYFEGDDTYEAGWYYDEYIYAYPNEDGTIELDDTQWLQYVIQEGQYAGYYLTPIYLPGSLLTPDEGPQLVELPDGVEAVQYIMNYTDNAGASASKAVFVGVDGNDVYFQGMSQYLTEAWVKGVKDGNTVTFAANQYMGDYGSYGASYAFYNGDAVFTYDAEAETYTAEGEIYGVLGGKYYDGRCFNPVLSKVIEKAAMPANPSISQIYASQYGDEVVFDVPIVDVDGDALLTSKLSFMFYIDIEKEVSPLTFEAGDDFPYLTEDMTEIPYGFKDTESGYDFYDGEIFLNMEHSTWNKIGIKSIYRGGGEENETEIQWFDIKPYASDAEPEANATWVAAEQEYENAQDITEFDIDEFTTGSMDIGSNSQNAPKYYTTGEAVRMYAGNSLTITTDEAHIIEKIKFNMTGSAKQMQLATDKGEYSYENAVGTWTGEEKEIVFTVPEGSGNQARIVSIELWYKSNLRSYVFTFDEGSLDPWTTIDADGDGFDWAPSPEGVSGHNATPGVFSKSYDSNAGALTPDNYLVSPKMALDGSITFWACAQDASYPAEHFGVYVSTAGNVSGDDFELAEEWTLTAARAKAPRKVQGSWYEYTVDLSSFAGQEGYVAIRHYNCSDQFYIVVDDITLKSSQVDVPDYIISPKEGEVKSIGDFTLTFNNYDVALVEGEVAQAELYKDENFDEPVATAALSVEGGNVVTFSFGEITDAGEYTLLIPDGTLKNVDEEAILGDLEFFYSIAAKPEVVVLPEGAEVETWYFTANSSESKVKGVEVGVAFVDNDIYVQGINQAYLPEAWVKGTLNGDGTATFAAGQYFGAFEYNGNDYDMFFVGTADGQTVSDATFDVDMEAGILSTEDYIVVNSGADQVSYYEYYYNVQITRDMPEFPEALVAPEDLVTETYLFKGFDTYNEEEESGREVQVGFYGNDQVWFQGLSNYLPEAWVMGTIVDGVVTIPETYLGVYETIDWNTYSMVEYETAFSAASFVYDGEAFTFTSAEGFSTYTEEGYLLDEYTDVVLTKIIETEATPADPSVANFALYYTPEEGEELEFRSYPYVSFDIPTVSVDGAPLVSNKLSYIVYIVDADDVEQELTITPDLYTEIEEEMTEIPYNFDDGYDIYAGGSTFYLNQAPEEIATWKKIGVQSIYRGLGIEHRSNIGWFDIQAYIDELKAIATGITTIKADGITTVYDLQGRRVAEPGKGLYIVNGQKVVLK